MNKKQISAAVEAVLFASGEPVEISGLADVLECDSSLILDVVLSLSAAYDERSSGIKILVLGDKCQMCSSKEYVDVVREILNLKKNTPLSPAAFEVLAVVAYNQPVTKAFIEQVRGVDCSGVISTLCQKKLIEESGRLDLPGRPLLYSTTPVFMRCFGISDMSQLPPLPQKETVPEQAESSDEASEEAPQTDTE